jgi:hypothetical protein
VPDFKGFIGFVLPNKCYFCYQAMEFANNRLSRLITPTNFQITRSFLMICIYLAAAFWLFCALPSAFAANR